MMTRVVCLVLFALLSGTGARGQASPAPLPVFRAVDEPLTFTLVDIRVVGVDSEEMARFIKRASGLVVGQKVTVPGDPVFSEVIHALYRLDLFSDVKIVERRRQGRGLFLDLVVTMAPRLAGLKFEGISEKHATRLRNRVPLYENNRIRPGDVERAIGIIQRYFEEEGYPLVDVGLRKEGGDGEERLTFVVNPGPRVAVGEIHITGNHAIDTGALLDQMKTTRPRAWWQFWKKSRFTAGGYREDLSRILDLYHEQGYIDARIVRDKTYLRGTPPARVVEVAIEEGPRYTIRSIQWEGNTVLSDEELTRILGLRPGQVYNGKRVEEALNSGGMAPDVTGMYLDRGYLRFQAAPRIRVVPGDSVDLVFDLVEGDVYHFGQVGVAGNRITRDHVVRRELLTIPGRPFSRTAIQQSLLNLVRLGYFTQESLGAGPDIRVDEEHRAVDVTYRVEDQVKNPFSIGGSYSDGLILQLGFNFNNFSLRNVFRPRRWHPFPTGDGQALSLSLQTTGGDYQRFDLSFTEPWFRARPNPLGLSVSYARIANGFRADDDNVGSLESWSTRIFHDRHLSPSLTLSSGVRYRYYDNRGWSTVLPDGRSHELVWAESLTHSTLDNPMFPRRGLLARLSMELAPRISEVQYHKWRFTGNWAHALGPAFSLNFSAELGYIGSLTGRKVAFQRFLVGGSPFDAAGFDTFYGQDIVYMRGYPARAIGTREDGVAVGGQVLNHYAAELGWMAVSKPALVAMPYLFFEAANAWDRLESWQPGDLFRAVGGGVRFNLPMLGLVEFSYGYNLDRFEPIRSHDGSRRWRFQFTMGRRFGF